MHEKEQGTPKDLDRFTETVNMCRRRHLDIVPKMAQAVFKLNHVNSSEGVTETVQYFLDRLYINRLDRKNKGYRFFVHDWSHDPNPKVGTQKSINLRLSPVTARAHYLLSLRGLYKW